MRGALSLAARLRSLPAEDLRALLLRRAPAVTGVQDHADLAEALLSRPNLDAALDRLVRPELALALELAAAETGIPAGSLGHDVPQRLDHLALIELADDGWHLYDAVAERLAERGVEADSLRTPDAVEPSERPDGLATERAFLLVSGVAELLHELAREPARRLQHGGLALPAARRLAERTGRPRTEIETLLSLADEAALAAGDSAWERGAEADSWLDARPAERWRILAAAWRGRLPPAALDDLAHGWRDGPETLLQRLLPLGGAERERFAERIGEAELLGIAVDGTIGAAGQAVLERRDADAEAAIGAAMPAPVERVYLQHDLSVIAPGPLRGDLDRRLRGVALAEGGGLASSYRITTETVEQALVDGETADDLLAFLGALSLTGVPQPLEYLIRSTAGRHGSLRAGPPAAEETEGPEPAVSVLHAEDPSVLDTVLVDQAVAPLALRRSGPHRALSRFDPEVLYWTLRDARYPVALEDAAGALVTPRRPVPAQRRSTGTAPYAALVERLAALPAPNAAEDEAGWIARRIELAVRRKGLVRLTVRMPDDRTVEAVLEPTSIAGGRVRARDRAADLERTLPLSRIVAVEPAD
ncbi:helicase-associated domain-containing protein [Arenivirga flava]|uniref:Helicase XPB/Ssl2 N-terminal domain-containing protein n=1 Tax=Arenivirga flava TaxID=1930060 RepID=A0AA37XC35_9MICO|nr:helicase-associated domain-containing protein [Arenivirga flava]GMA29401.1 hypothetical protein GCM10025874_26540 [Arenivirga flava]